MEVDEDDWEFHQMPDQEDLDMPPPAGSVHSSMSKSRDRAMRARPAKSRTKFDTAKWDGMSSTFRIFNRSLEGHLLQVGAGYLIQKAFVKNYKVHRSDYFKTDKFWSLYRVSEAQALSDREYLYGILVSATKHQQHKTIIKYQKTMDGIIAWDEFKEEFEYDGSKELRLEELEQLVQNPFSSTEPRGMVSYIDRHQAYMAELDVIEERVGRSPP